MQNSKTIYKAIATIILCVAWQISLSQEIEADIKLRHAGDRLLMDVVLTNSSNKDYVMSIPNYFDGLSHHHWSHRNMFAEFVEVLDQYTFDKDTMELTFPFSNNPKEYKSSEGFVRNFDDIIHILVCNGDFGDYDELWVDQELREKIKNNDPFQVCGLSSCYIIHKKSKREITLDVSFTTYLRTNWKLSFMFDEWDLCIEARHLVRDAGLEMYHGKVKSNTIFFSTKGNLHH